MDIGAQLPDLEMVSLQCRYDDASIRVLLQDVNRQEAAAAGLGGIRVKTQSGDTHPQIESIIVESYRSMSASDKFKIIDDLTRATLSLTISGVRNQHPEADERECRLRAASRWLDSELMRKAYGWDPRVKGY